MAHIDIQLSIQEEIECYIIQLTYKPLNKTSVTQKIIENCQGYCNILQDKDGKGLGIRINPVIQDIPEFEGYYPQDKDIHGKIILRMGIGLWDKTKLSLFLSPYPVKTLTPTARPSSLVP